MKKIALTSILTISIVAPAMGAVGDKTINAGANSAPCTSATLDTQTGPAALEADWTANTIRINWDAKNGTTITPTECTYDSTITLPATPSKTGYTFGGWTVKAGLAQCDLSELDADEGGEYYLSKSFAGDHCIYPYYYYSEADDDYLPGEMDDCSDSVFDDLSNGKWEVSFSYGTVKGTAYCSGKSGYVNDKTGWNTDSSNWSATESELTGASGEAKYCWCKVTEYTPDGGEMCVSASESWVFVPGFTSASKCASDCVQECTHRAYYDNDSSRSFRAAIFVQSN